MVTMPGLIPLTDCGEVIIVLIMPRKCSVLYLVLIEHCKDVYGLSGVSVRIPSREAIGGLVCP